jgi:WD repeat-containing protein 44
MVIASADSKIRVSEGAGIAQKFEGQISRQPLSLASSWLPFSSTAYALRRYLISVAGRWSSKALLPPCLTSDGRYLVSAGADSNVCIWNFDASPAGSGRRCSRSVRSCELFFSKGGVTSVATWQGPHERGSGGEDLRSPENGPTVCRDRERCWFGTWFFADGTRGAATWPEEKLLPSLKYVNCTGMDNCHSKVSAAWNVVIITGGRDGVIRCFHNYGLPVKL